MRLISLLMLCLACGCSDKTVAGPPATTVSTVEDTGIYMINVMLDDGQIVKAKVERYGPNLVKILYLCDYPLGYYGPLQQGHCYADGSSCVGEPGSWDPNAYTAPPMPGRADAPTSTAIRLALAQTKLTVQLFEQMQREGDGDGTVVR